MNYFIYLQTNKTFIVMKINLFLSAAVLSAFCVSCGPDSERVELFNGSDLSGWECFVDPTSEVPVEEVYSVVDGNIRIAGQPFG